MGIPNVVWHQCPILLLTCCVPELQFICVFIKADIFGQEINSDSALNNKLSYIDAFIKPILGKPFNDGRFPCLHFAQKYDLIFDVAEASALLRIHMCS
jgi:hypothetical protein